MVKILRVARHHFVKEASNRSFLLVLFSLPFFLILVLGLGYLSASLMEKMETIGYVDQANIITMIPDTLDAEKVTFVQFETPELAREALNVNQIDGYYVVKEDYQHTRQADLFYLEEISGRAQYQFSQLVKINLLSSINPQLVNRIVEGNNVKVKAIDTNRDYSSGGPESGQILPLVAAGMFAFLVLTSSGYMMQVMVEEKENRTMEVIITSISPGQMMIGKILGAVAIAALQLLVWIAFLLAGIWVGIHVLNSSWLGLMEPAWRDVFLVILVAVPSYLMLTAITTAIGTILVDSQEAQQIGPLIFLLLMVPIYLFLPIARNPEGPLAMFFSFFPTSSVVTFAMRSMVTAVPVWQYILSAVIAFICALAGIWLAGKAFRLSLVRYGQRLTFRELARFGNSGQGH